MYVPLLLLFDIIFTSIPAIVETYSFPEEWCQFEGVHVFCVRKRRLLLKRNLWSILYISFIEKISVALSMILQ